MIINFNQFADEIAAFLYEKQLYGNEAADALKRAYYSSEDRTIYFDDPTFPTSRAEKELVIILRRKHIDPEEYLQELKKYIL